MYFIRTFTVEVIVMFCVYMFKYIYKKNFFFLLIPFCVYSVAFHCVFVAKQFIAFSLLPINVLVVGSFFFWQIFKNGMFALCFVFGLLPNILNTPFSDYIAHFFAFVGT